VFTVMNSTRIDELAIKISQAKSGSIPYLAVYHKARKQLEKKLTEKERQMYRATAKKWTEGKLPRKMQQQYVYQDSRLESTNLSKLGF